MTRSIRYCVTVDTEEEWDWSSGYSTGPTSVRNIERLPVFHDLCENAGAAVVYFTTHSVLAHDESRGVMQSLARRPRTEIGLHVHSWNTPPLAETRIVSAKESFLDNLPWEEQRSKLDATLDLFRVAGLQPTSYRGGRYCTSLPIQQYLHRHGLWVDCSILPGNTWADEGAPDYRDRDLSPRRVVVDPGCGAAIWELPLTFGNTFTKQAAGMRWLNRADTKLGRAIHLTGILDRLNILSKCWLNFENPLGHRMPQFLEVLRKIRPPFITFTLHSSSLLPGGSPYNRTEKDVQRMSDRMSQILNLVRSWPEFQPATVTEIAEHLEAQHR